MNPDLFPGLREHIEQLKTDYELAKKECQEDNEYLMKSPALPLLGQVGLVLLDFYPNNVYLTANESLVLTPELWVLTHPSANIRLSWGFTDLFEEGRQKLGWQEIVVMVKRDTQRKIIGVELNGYQTVNDQDIFELAEQLATTITQPVHQFVNASRRSDPRNDFSRVSLELGAKKYNRIERNHENKLVGLWHNEDIELTELIAPQSNIIGGTTNRRSSI